MITGSLFATCVLAAAQFYQLPDTIVHVVASVEGGATGDMNRNRNGSLDLGRMQVNTIHLPELSRHYGLSEGALADLIARDDCVNAYIGTWLLRREIDRAGGNFWQGVGRYHSRRADLKDGYIGRVVRKAVELYGPSIFGK